MLALDEFDLVRKYFAPLAAGAEGAFALSDDAAVLDCGGEDSLVVTSDCLIEGVHFRSDDPADLIARKLLRVNLSDLAAMGARPTAYILNAAFSDAVGSDWLEGFAAGLGEDQRLFEISLLGGDTVAAAGATTLAVTAFGHAAPDRLLRRAGASEDEAVFVSGTIGDAHLGLAMIEGRVDVRSSDALRYLVGQYRLPEPRVRLGQALAGIATAGIDVSDGLVADLGHLSTASGVGIEIELEAVPLSPAAREAVTGNQPLQTSLLAGGDDYELAFTAPESETDRLFALGRKLYVPLTCIGKTVHGTGVVVRDGNGHEIDTGDGGYRHFHEGATDIRE